MTFLSKVFLLSLSHVQLFATPWTVACQAPLSLGILQARILEWVAMPSSKGPSQPRDQTQVSPALQVNSLPTEPPGKESLLGVPTLENEWPILSISFKTLFDFLPPLLTLLKSTSFHLSAHPFIEYLLCAGGCAEYHR